MTLSISAFVICHNEASAIERCIRSLSMCGEIVVVDSGSDDGTLDILARLAGEGFPLRVLHQDWRGFGAQKQFALDQCRLDWCLSLDSDERVSPRLAAALPGMLARDDVDGWRLTRYDYLPGYGYVPPAAHERFHQRMFRRGKGGFDPSDLVHEGIRIEGRVEKARQGGLLHFTPVPVSRQLQKFDRYSTLKARMQRQRGKPLRPWKMLVSPVVFFFRWYLRYGQWRCGWAGIIRSAHFAIYSFLTEAKRWEDAALEHVPPVEPPPSGRY